MSSDSGFAAAWLGAELGLRRSLELAHLALVAGGLSVGSVIVDSSGAILAEGRNRAYDPPGGDDPLQGSPVAHAEMNALARIPTATDLSVVTLWSSHRPCTMCAAACAFTGVGAVRFVAPDPSDDDGGPDPEGADDRWLLTASLMFLSAVSAYSGPAAPMISRARSREPETTELLDVINPAALRAATLPESLAPAWPQIVAAAQERRGRRR
jgi:tRNA(Arg) A34 adenosine deaminase TadA